ncbi:hypothetical protein HGA88_01680 [Candidatus Roizmanbacteria bacterium]|nr:hypothetical protein [Candidatus Roizmanbacteria bacterium]
MEFKYDNIAISGGIGVGTTTLMSNLRPYLEPYGWKLESMGQFIRGIMNEFVMPTATLVTEEFDREIEKKQHDIFEQETHRVIESWLAGFMARDLPKTLKILVVCSNEAIRIDRVVNRDKVTVDEAKQNIRVREEENFKKWRQVYGDFNFFDPNFFDLIVDTYSVGPIETVGKVLDKLGYDNGKIVINKKA